MSFSPAAVSGTENSCVIYFGEMAVCSVYRLCPQSEFPPGVQTLPGRLGQPGFHQYRRGLVLLVSPHRRFSNCCKKQGCLANLSNVPSRLVCFPLLWRTPGSMGPRHFNWAYLVSGLPPRAELDLFFYSQLQLMLPVVWSCFYHLPELTHSLLFFPFISTTFLSVCLLKILTHPPRSSPSCS